MIGATAVDFQNRYHEEGLRVDLPSRRKSDFNQRYHSNPFGTDADLPQPPVVFEEKKSNNDSFYNTSGNSNPKSLADMIKLRDGSIPTPTKNNTNKNNGNTPNNGGGSNSKVRSLGDHVRNK